MSHAANALGLSRSALYRRLQRYGLMIDALARREAPQASPGSRAADSRDGAGGRLARGDHVACWCCGWAITRPRVQWTLTAVIVGIWLGFCFALRERVASPLRTLANLLEAMREGDYSIRARHSKSDDAMGEVMQQVNAMSATLREQRLGAMEATTLLRKVMEEINVAVFAFDGDRPAAPGESRRRTAAECSPRCGCWIDRRSCWDSSQYLEGEAQRTEQRTFPGRDGALGHQPQPVSRRRPAAPVGGGHRSDAAPCVKKS